MLVPYMYLMFLVITVALIDFFDCYIVLFSFQWHSYYYITLDVDGGQQEECVLYQL